MIHRSKYSCFWRTCDDSQITVKLFEETEQQRPQRQRTKTRHVKMIASSVAINGIQFSIRYYHIIQEVYL